MNRIKSFTFFIVLGIFVQWCGGSLNDFTMAHNHYKMPVWCLSPALMVELSDKRHAPYTADSRFFILDDVIPVPIFSRDGNITLEFWSVGDTFIFGGILMYIFSPLALIRRGNAKKSII